MKGFYIIFSYFPLINSLAMRSLHENTQKDTGTSCRGTSLLTNAHFRSFQAYLTREYQSKRFKLVNKFKRDYLVRKVMKTSFSLES